MFDSTLGLRRAARYSLALLAVGLALAGLLSLPLVEAPLSAAPAAQSQPSPQPSLQQRPTPGPTKSPEQQLQELQIEKTNREISLLREQRDMLGHQQEIDSQIWRAPAAFIRDVGPVVIGLGLLYLLARALSHFLPPAPPRPASLSAEEEDDDEDL
jgi:hypothetical protein